MPLTLLSNHIIIVAGECVRVKETEIRLILLDGSLSSAHYSLVVNSDDLPVSIVIDNLLCGVGSCFPVHHDTNERKNNNRTHTPNSFKYYSNRC